jgi:2-octaprenyl-6-methoxyphenol hydroxylase
MVEDRYLRRALLAAMKSSGVDHRGGVSVVEQEVTPGGVTVTLADGTRLSGRLLVGADGRTSGVAQRAGIRRMGWDYGQTALVSCIAHERPHDGVAHQYFMPSGPLAILPLTGNRSSIVWSEQTEVAGAISRLNDAGYLAALRPRFGDFLGEIGLVGARFAYPLSLSMTYGMVAPRVALVGDAGHGVHPVAGQGLNLGFRDVGALAETLILSRRLGEDFGAIDVLNRYQEWRRFDTVALAAGMDGFVRLFSNDNPILRGVRDIGLGVVNAVPGLRRAFMREAAGLSGAEIPRLLRGLAI